MTLDLLIDPAHPAVGRSLADLNLPRDAVITSVLRDGAVLIPRGPLCLAAGDHLQVLTTIEARETVLASFGGGNGAVVQP